MPLCEGRPNLPCPRRATGKLSQGDLIMCRKCEEFRFPYLVTESTANKDSKSKSSMSKVRTRSTRPLSSTAAAASVADEGKDDSYCCTKCAGDIITGTGLTWNVSSCMCEPQWQCSYHSQVYYRHNWLGLPSMQTWRSCEVARLAVRASQASWRGSLSKGRGQTTEIRTPRWKWLSHCGNVTYCGWITQLKQQIWKRRYYLSAHWLNDDVLLSNSAFFIFAVLVVWFSHSHANSVTQSLSHVDSWLRSI